MFIAAFALGIWFSWLLDLVAKHDPKWRARVRKSRKTRRRIAAVFFFLALSIYCFSLATEHYQSAIQWPRRATRFVTTPVHARAIIWFILGAVLYHYRAQIVGFVQDLLVEAPDRWTKATDPNARPQPRQWLTTAGGLPILATLLTLTILVYFGEDLRIRLKSIKLGVAEADFVTATQETLRMTVRQESPMASLDRSYLMLRRGFEYEEIFTKILAPTSKLLTKPLEGTDVAARARWAKVERFHNTITFPFSRVMACYSGDFPPNDTEVHGKIVRAATEWRLASVRLAQLTKTKRLSDAEEMKKVSQTFCKAVCTTLAAMDLATKDIDALAQDTKPCKHLRLNKPPLAACVQPMPPGTCPPTTDDLESTLSEVLLNGSVISFVSGLIAATQSHQAAAAYMDEIGEAFEQDASIDDPISKMYFYLRRAQTKFAGRWYPKDAPADLRRARGFVEHVWSAADLASKRTSKHLQRHFETTRALIINNQIYYTIFHWLEGQQLTPYETSSLELLGQELAEWLNSRWVRALVLTDDRATMLKNQVVAASQHTLAMSDIAIGATKGDFTQERCDRIRARLGASEEWYKQLHDQSAAPYRDSLRLVETHRSIYESVCTQ